MAATVIELLKTGEARVSRGNAWLYWDGETGEWVVLQRPYYAKKNQTLVRTICEAIAVKALEEA